MRFCAIISGGTVFNMMALDHMHQLTIFKQGNGRRRGRIRQHALSLFNGIDIETGKLVVNWSGLTGLLWTAIKNTWAGGSGTTTANGIDHYQRGNSWLPNACSTSVNNNSLNPCSVSSSFHGEVLFLPG